MKLVLLGTTGYHPNDRRQTACMMIPELGIILDAGTAMYRVRDYLATNELDIYISHAHLDHIIGLTFLFDIVQDKDIRRVTVHGDKEKLAQVQEHLFAPALFPVKPPLEYRALPDEVALPGGGKLTRFPLKHPGGCLGFRLDWPGHSLAYVTDTTAVAGASYIEHIRGVDLLLHECYFPDDQHEMAELTGHSFVTPVAEVARTAGVKRLVLVHICPMSEADDPLGLATAKAIFPNTCLGEDFMELEF